MAGVSPEWERCEVSSVECIGQRIGSDGGCLNHTADAVWSDVLDAASEGKPVAALRGTPVTAAQIDEFLGVVPKTADGRPTVAYLDLRLAQVESGADFSEARIGADVKFDGTTFGDEVEFCGVTFVRARFRDANFGHVATFAGSTFGDDAWFTGATFGDWTSFIEAEFGNRIWFDKTTFGDDTTFGGATFGDKATFDDATMGHDPKFTATTFGERASFKRTEFGNLANFSRATFGDDAWFDGASFGTQAYFELAEFSGDARFDKSTFGHEASFRKAKFSNGTNFSEATFGDGVRFGGATFGDDVRFDEVTFGKYVGFGGTEFGLRATFSEATLGHGPDFGLAIFGDGASFGGATFGPYAGFGRVRFGGGVSFDDATFGDQAAFHGVTFSGGMTCQRATFEGDTRFDEVAGHGSLDLAEAWFKGQVMITGVFTDSLDLQRSRISRLDATVAAAQIVLSAARVAVSSHLRIGWARIDVDQFESLEPCIIDDATERIRDNEEWWERLDGEHPPEAMQDGEGPSRGVRRRAWLASLAHAHAPGLALRGVDLAHCRFVGAHALDEVRLGRTADFEQAPARLARRQVIAEEVTWRHEWATSSRWARIRPTCRAWSRPRDRIDAGDPLPAVEIASIYRSLRTGREQRGDEPGAADFYYGEMEMRRLDPGAPRTERIILHLYWLLSGYGLRASRALVLLTFLVAGATWWLTTSGFVSPAETGAGGWDALLVAVESAVLRSTETSELTETGRWITVGLRLVSPVLLGLAVLALRGRVKR